MVESPRNKNMQYYLVRYGAGRMYVYPKIEKNDWFFDIFVKDHNAVVTEIKEPVEEGDTVYVISKGIFEDECEYILIATNESIVRKVWNSLAGKENIFLTRITAQYLAMGVE